MEIEAVNHISLGCDLPSIHSTCDCMDIIRLCVLLWKMYRFIPRLVLLTP